MEIRKLGKNGPALTVIGLGMWAIGGGCQFYSSHIFKLCDEFCCE